MITTHIVTAQHIKGQWVTVSVTAFDVVEAIKKASEAFGPFYQVEKVRTVNDE